MKPDEQKESISQTRPRVKIQAPRLSDAERKLKMAERNALLMQLVALEEYLGVRRRCRKCGEDV